MAEARRIAAPMTVTEFRNWADRQPGKWELVDGWPRAMAPASATHGLIQLRAGVLIERHIEDTRSPCRAVTEAPVVPSSFKRHNARAADLAITCTPPIEDEWELKEPVFILEVLSPSNQQDTRDNVWMYMTIPSVRQILLLESTSVRGEMFQRQGNGTWPEEAEALVTGDIVHVEPIRFSCPLDSFYARTSLASP
jgi:Uma2 family endonuclease